MSNARRLAEGTGCWMHHEYVCMRAGLFDESALKAVVGQVASTLVTDRPARCWSGVPHEALVPYALANRKPAVDFVVAELNGNMRGPARVAIEAKWAGSSHCTSANILTDLLRLAVLHRHLKSKGIDCECIFLLAGSKKDIKAKMRGELFNGPAALPFGLRMKRIRWRSLQQLRSGQAAMGDSGSTSLRVLIEKEGAPDFNASFSPGLPQIAMKHAPQAVDESIRFYAMAWTIASL